MKNFEEQEERVSALENKISLVNKFVTVKKLEKSDANVMIEEAHALLRTPDVESAVRIGDIYGHLFRSVSPWPPLFV